MYVVLKLFVSAVPGQKLLDAEVWLQAGVVAVGQDCWSRLACASRAPSALLYVASPDASTPV